MIRYFGKKILSLCITVPAIVLAVYFLVYMLPSTSAGELETLGNDSLDSVLSTLSLHDTFFGRYIRYMYDVIVRGTFGTGPRNMRMDPYLRTRAVNTGILAGTGVLLSAAVGIPAGIWAAYRKNKAADQLIGTVSFVMYSIPPYILAIIGMVIFCVKLGWSPVIADYDGLSDFILPASVVSVGGIAEMTRASRSAALEALSARYIRVLRGKGLPERRVLFVHVLRNAVPSLTAALNNVTVRLLCGTLIVENFFGIPGLGRCIIESVNNRNQHALLGSVFILSTVILAAGIMYDMIAAALSPAVRRSCRSERSTGK